MSGEEAPEKKAEAVPEVVATTETKTEEAPKIDVSKPAPRPDKAEFEKKCDEINAEVTGINEQLAGLDGKISEARMSGGDQSEELREARTTMKSLRERRDVVMRDRQEIAALQKQAKASLDAKISTSKSLRSELKYSSAEEIEKKIAELEKKQSTTSMSLKDEKQLLKEIEQLKQSKKFVKELTANNDSISTDRASTKSIQEQVASKNAELDVLKKKIEEQKEILEGLNEQNSERRAVLPALYKEKDALRKSKSTKVESIKALRTEFRAAEKKFYDHKNEVKRQRLEAKKVEDDARRTEYEAKKKAQEEEELKRIPYEEEMELCKYLVNYLETTYPAAFGNKAADAADAAGADAAASEFEGMVLGGKKGKNDDSEDYCNLGVTHGKKKGRGKKKGGLKVSEKIIIAPETIEIFSWLNLEPPMSISTVPETCKKLDEKLAWFKTTERGAVKSIREKRKEAEEKKPKREPRGDADATGDAPKDKPVKETKPPKAGFNAAAKEEDLFPSLPAAPPKPVAAPVAAEPTEEVKGGDEE